MHIEGILNRFDGVRGTGNGQYSCRCPAHEDKSASLGIKEGDGERILLNCFAGCDLKSVLDAAGLEWKDILPDNKLYQADKHSFNPFAVLKMIRDEVLIIGLASAQIRDGKPLNDKDHDRLLKAVGNVRDAYSKTK
jgi:hypothetical protein